MTTNPFVRIKTTGEVGRVISKLDDGSVDIELFSSPSNSEVVRLQSSGVEKYTPETNGLVWVPIKQGSKSKPFLVHHRGTFQIERDSGTWAIKVRYLGDKPDVDVEVDPNLLVILRSGNNFDAASALGNRLTMSTKYFVTRQKLLDKIYSQLEVARGFSSILSSGVRPFQHQINTLVRVMTDPIPRFILADEVGLGKTIEAGLIVRQILKENPLARALIVCPNFLVGQWADELSEKLLLTEELANKRIAVVEYGDLPTLGSFDVLIVDEAHRIVTTKNETIYNQIKKKVMPSTIVLLLTATPMRGNRVDFLKLLHLLDPMAYPLDREDDFESRMALREQSARAIDNLKLPGLPTASLKQYLSHLQDLFPNDVILQDAREEIFRLIEQQKDVYSKSLAVSFYLRDAYQISRRVIRNRRDEVVEQGFVVAGRELNTNGPVQITEVLRASVDAFIINFLDGINRQLDNQDISAEHANYLVSSIVESALSAPEILADQLQISGLIDGGSGLSEELEHQAQDLEKLIRGSSPSKRWEKLHEICAGHVHHPNSSGAVVFMHTTASAIRFARELSEKFGEHQVSIHTSDMTIKERDVAVRQFLTTSGCRILVMDQSGEEGRNLQNAAEVVHFSLPLSPNQLEQRLGRSDRFKEGSSGRAVSTVFVEPDSLLSSGHYHFLAVGLKVFIRSIATAQRFLSHQYQDLILQLMAEGLDAFSGSHDELTEKLQEEIDEISYLDQMESSGSTTEFSRADVERLLNVDEESDIEEAAIGFYVTDKHRNPPTAPLGLLQSPSKFQRQNLTQTMRLTSVLPNGQPADLRELTQESKRQLENLVQKDNEYVFSRPVVRALQGTKIYRVGDPLVDWTSNFIETDQMGRTWAVWRTIRGENVAPTRIFSASIRVGGMPNVDVELGIWGTSNLRRRVDLAVPPRLLKLAFVGGRVFDHTDLEFRKNIPWASLVDTNMGDDHWLRAQIGESTFSTEVEKAASAMVEYAKQLSIRPEMVDERRARHREMHDSIMKTLETDIAKNGDTSAQSQARLAEEEIIAGLIEESLNSPVCSLFSMGLIFLTSEKA